MTSSLRVRTAAGVAGLLATGLLVPSATATPTTPAPRVAQSVSLVTFNLDKNLGPRRWQHDWDRFKTKADIVFFQEASKIRVSTLATSPTWRVLQATGRYSSEVALAVRSKSVPTVVDFHVKYVLPHQSCGSHHGVGSRYLAFAHVVLADGRRLTVASTHLPPARCFGSPYSTMMKRVRTWARNHQRHLALGADWNKRVTGDPGSFVQKTALRPRGVGIDGFQISERIPAGSARRIGVDSDYRSDHIPVQVGITR